MNQQAKSVADVLLNDPNVRVARGFGNFQELYVIRGFPAYSDDMTYNGIYGILPRQFVAAEFLERVEVFRGASAFLNGAAPGGSNLGGTSTWCRSVRRMKALTRLTAGFESDGSGMIAADVGRRFGDDQATGIRANARLPRRRDVRPGPGSPAVRAVARRRSPRRQVAPLGRRRLPVPGHRRAAPQRVPGVRSPPTVPDAPDADKNFAQPWTYTKEKQVFGVVRAEYDITSAVSVWGAAGMRDGEEKNVLSNPNAQADGSTQSYRFDNSRKDKVYSGELGLRWDFATGPVEHRIIVSGSLFSLESDNAYAFSEFFAGFTSDLYHPVDCARASRQLFHRRFAARPAQDVRHRDLELRPRGHDEVRRRQIHPDARCARPEAEDRHLRLQLGRQGSPATTRARPRRSAVSCSARRRVVVDIRQLHRGPRRRRHRADRRPGRSQWSSMLARPRTRTRPNRWKPGVKYDGGNFGAGLSVFNIEKAHRHPRAGRSRRS